jgi:signal transduction histidine kinase
VFQWQIVDLAELLNEFVDSQAYVLAEQGFQLTCRVDASLVEPILVRIDPTQFRRVLDNILSNSIKYKEEGSDGWLNINLHIQGNAYQIEFTDGGRGVSSEELSRLFETFYRTDKARSAAAKGNGLGLAVTKKIIEGMQGEVWAEAARPKGLKICITLPRLSPEIYL